MRASILGLAGLAAVAWASPAPTRLDAIKARGVLLCGGVPNQGVATRDDMGIWSGSEVEMCRTVAVAILGKADFAFRPYESTENFDRARTGKDDVSFLTAEEIAQQKLDNRLQIGPPAVVARQSLMVPDDSSYRHPADLAGHAICFMIATTSDNALEAWASAHKIDFIPNAFQERDEMADAYNVQRCQAVAGDANDLAALRRDGGINHLRSRVLPEALATVAVLAATPRDSDTRWGDLVARILATPAGMP